MSGKLIMAFTQIGITTTVTNINKGLKEPIAVEVVRDNNKLFVDQEAIYLSSILEALDNYQFVFIYPDLKLAAELLSLQPKSIPINFVYPDYKYLDGFIERARKRGDSEDVILTMEANFKSQLEALESFQHPVGTHKQFKIQTDQALDQVFAQLKLMLV